MVIADAPAYFWVLPILGVILLGIIIIAITELTRRR